jgi:hypothetical protein
MTYRASSGTIQAYAAIAGVVLVLVGLLGFLNTPIVGENGFFATDALHNIVHTVTGLYGLYVAFGLRGSAQVQGMLIFAILYLVILVVVFLSPTLFGLFSVPANAPLHVVHAALAVAGFATYFLGRQVADSYSA